MRIAGYAALFGTPDAARDTIVPGAFAATLARRSEPLPLYWQHRPDQPIGLIEAASEDARGLRIIARIDNPNSHAAALLRTRSVSGLSFGYCTNGIDRHEVREPRRGTAIDSLAGLCATP